MRYVCMIYHINRVENWISFITILLFVDMYYIMIKVQKLILSEFYIKAYIFMYKTWL